MTSKVKNVSHQVWKDFIRCAGLFTSFCGLVGSFVSLVNAISPKTVGDLPTKADSKSGKRIG